MGEPACRSLVRGLPCCRLRACAGPSAIAPWNVFRQPNEDVSTMSNFSQNPPMPPRLRIAVDAIRHGRAVVLVDDDDRENEGDLIVAAERLTVPMMATLIRECSGIVCLCLEDEQIERLELPPMVARNESRFGTAFTVSIEAREGVTTGVSAADRVTTIRAATAADAKPADLV